MGKKAKKTVDIGEVVNGEMPNVFHEEGEPEKKPRKAPEFTVHGETQIGRFSEGGVMDELIVAYSDSFSEVEKYEKLLEDFRKSRDNAYRACVLDLRHKERMRNKVGVSILKGAA